MSKNINIGTYGWRHKGWSGDYYPADLPVDSDEDWRLAYYSNEFNCVLVPSSYWTSLDDGTSSLDCKQWLDEVNEDFKFFVECNEVLLGHVSLEEVARQLRVLQPQLSALVFLNDKQQISQSLHKKLSALADLLEVSFFVDSDLVVVDRGIWRRNKQGFSNFAYLEDALSDLRLARTIVDDYLSQVSNESQLINGATIIVNSPCVSANDLSRFRAVVEMMGY